MRVRGPTWLNKSTEKKNMNGSIIDILDDIGGGSGN